MKKLSKADVARMALIDELGQLEQDIAPMKEKEKKASELRAQVRAWHEKDPASESATHEGHKFIVTVGACENERSIKSLEVLYNVIGPRHFLSACSMTLAKLKALVTPPMFDAHTVQSRTGARPVKSFPRSK